MTCFPAALRTNLPMPSIGRLILRDSIGRSIRYAGTELGFEIGVRGDVEEVIPEGGKKIATEVVSLENFLLKSPDSQFSANGELHRSEFPGRWTSISPITNAPRNQVPVAIASAPQDKVLSGTVEGHARIAGTLQPARLQRKRAPRRPRDRHSRPPSGPGLRLVISDRSHINSTGVFIFTDELKLFGGNWDLDGIYLFDSGGLNVDVAMKDVNSRTLPRWLNNREYCRGDRWQAEGVSSWAASGCGSHCKCHRPTSS